jgi:hypothetical protein
MCSILLVIYNQRFVLDQYELGDNDVYRYCSSDNTNHNNELYCNNPIYVHMQLFMVYRIMHHGYIFYSEPNNINA